MKNHKMYEADDKMISLISDNYDLLQALGSFGINLGFGDKTVREVCDSQNVDTYTFLSIVNFTMNGYKDYDDADRLSIPTLVKYLKAFHTYYLDFQLPFIRKKLVDSLDENDNLARLILKLYDEYSHDIRNHMQYEEKTVFPYVDSLLAGQTNSNYDIETFSKHHKQTDVKQNDVSVKISSMLSKQPDMGETLSDREKDVIICVVQGMTNKEIANHLCISTNTVITHRRNIARKLQIHSPAGLTIYAIVNNLVDIGTVNL